VDYLDYLESTDGTQFQDFDVADFLEQSQKNERQRLKKELELINRQLEERDRIHQETLDELESKLDWYTDRLEILYKQSRGKNEKREKLKTQIKEFYREIREEKQSHWRDRQELEQDRRDIIRELNELEDNILDLI